MVSISSDERRLLSYVIDDYFGLWELPGYDGTREQRDRIAALLTGLAEKGLLMAYRGIDFAGEEVMVKPKQLVEALSPPYWEQPSSTSVQVRILATPAGVLAYQGSSE